MSGLSGQQLAEIQARAEAATAGPWMADGAEIYRAPWGYVVLDLWVGETLRIDDQGGSNADAEFVAHARTDVPALLARVAELEAERHERNEWLEDAAKALRAKDQRIAELENAGPSRFTATPAEVDVHLRTVLAEDTYLAYQRAIGDAVLDEIQTSGKTFRAGQEAEHAKHVYLAGMDDVLTAIWDDRYYPAKLLCSQHNGFGPCPGSPWCKPEAVTHRG